MKTAYIIINGNLSRVPSLAKIVLSKDVIICADGAAEQVYKQKIVPHIIIGDLDSISTEVREFYKKKKVKFIQYPREKDYTDAELAISYAIKKKYKNIVVCGLLGDRIDHMLSNIFYIAKLTKGITCKIIEGSSEMYVIQDKIVITGQTGDEVSLIPLKNCYFVTTSGLYYALSSETLKYGETRGVSNIVTKKRITISLKKGVLLIVHNRL